MKRVRAGLPAVFAAAAALAFAAGSIGPATGHEMRDLAGSEWTPLELRGAPLAEGVEVFVAFGGDGRVSGKGGCNRFGGTYAQGGHDLRLDALVATRIACPPPQDEVERAVFAALGRVAYAEEPEAGRLSLFDADGALLMILSPRDRD